MNVEKLKSAYASNKGAKAICDEMASRDRNQNETKLHRMLRILSTDGNNDLKKSEVISGFRSLEEAACGSYVEGRHGWPSRFIWEVKSLEVAAAARGERAPDHQGLLDSADDPEMIEHSFVLRPDLTVAFELPDDLTKPEAARLAGFLQTLPFDRAQ